MKYILLLLLIFLAGCSQVELTEDVEVLLDSLSNPWGMTFIDQNSMLITQNVGEIIYYDFNSVREISGVPSVESSGQGGLLDIEYDDGYVYITYSASGPGGRATHLGRGRLNLDSFSLEDFEVLRVITPFISGGAHFGSRILIVNNHLYMTTGDRGSKDFSENHPSQDTSNEIGTIIRLYKNGSVPQDNPFIENEEFMDSIYTYGHRNVQGIVYHNGDIWISEHGEQDGDMIHKLVTGGNYGWPLVHYGCTYVRGTPIGGFAHERDDIVNPIHYWECGSGGFPPAGMDFYNDRLFLGGLRSQYLAEFELTEDGGLREVNQHLEGHRVRDVMAYDEGVLALTDGGLLLQISLN